MLCLVLLFSASSSLVNGGPAPGRLAEAQAAPFAPTAYVPGAGSWSSGIKLERVVHAFDLPGTDNELLLCAGSGNSVEWASQRRFQCYRYDRDTRTYTVLDTPTDWFCNAAVHMHDGRVLVAGGTGPDGYPSMNGGRWAGAPETYSYAPVSGQVTRLGDAAPAWYPGLLEDQRGGIYKHGGTHNGVANSAWEYLPQGQTRWTQKP